MHIRARIVAGTALALIMTATYASASVLSGAQPSAQSVRALVDVKAASPLRDGNLLLVQAAEEDDEELSEEERRRRREAQQQQEESEEEESERGVEPAPGEAAPTPPEQEAEPPADSGVEPAPDETEPPQEETAPEPPQQEAEPPADSGVEPAPDETESPQEETTPEPPQQEAEPPADSGVEPAPDETESPQEETAPQPLEQEVEPPADSGVEPAPGETESPQEETAPQPLEQGEQPADSGVEPAPGQPTPPQQEPAPQPPAQGEQPPADSGVEPAPGQPTPPQQEPAPQPPAQGEQPPADSGVEPVTGSPDQAPILDSEKESEATGEAGEQPAQQPLPEEAGPPPTSDEEAQQFEEPVEVQSLRTEEGRRIERPQERRERPEGSRVLREIGDRFVIQLNNQIIVQSDDRGRIERDASEVYYEELPRGRTRETVVRPNGVQVVTVYDRYGDVIRRSRIMPDGREHVLVYAGDYDRDRGGERRQWRDPGLDLPPLRLTIPAEEYILDAGRVRSDEIYYDFLDQPPVDRVRRLYSVDEVRYSARVRDSVRRIDLDTITFDFGSASISEEAIPRLSGVAEAMERLLDRNPGEVFLIEGHTDAVGSDEANLALSDRRAEAVAMAMTNVFGIPAENLVTQGYGERYLKINTQEPERENRRVAIRRITPLVAPVAQN